MQKLRFIPLVAALFCMAAIFAAPTHKKSETAKARYYYLKGAALESAGKKAEAYEMYRYAESLDPDYSEAAWSRSMLELGADASLRPRSQEAFDSMLLVLRPFTDKYPDDLNEAITYANFSATVADNLPEAERIFRRTINRSGRKSELHTQIASLRMRQGDLEGTINELIEYETAQGGASELTTMQKVNCRMAFGDSIGAINDAVEFARLNPRNVHALLLAGNINFFMQRTDSAIYWFDKAVELAPNSGTVNMSLANFYAASGDSVKYDNHVYAALVADDYDLEEKTDILGEYLQDLINEKKNTVRGDSLFNVLSRQYPHDPELRKLSARYEAAKGNFAKAEEEMSYAIDLDPSDPEAWFALMSFQTMLGERDNLRSTYNRSQQYIRPLLKATELYAYTCIFDKDYPEAIATFTSLIDDYSPGLNPTDSLTEADVRKISADKAIIISGYLGSIADCYAAAEDIPNTALASRNALLFYPDNVNVLNNFAYVLATHGGDLDEALQMSTKAIELDPENPVYLDTYAWIFFLKGDYEKAREYEEKALKCYEEGDSPDAEFLDHYGDILFLLGEKQQALDQWKKALEQDSDNDLLRRKVKQKTYIKQ